MKNFKHSFFLILPLIFFLSTLQGSTLLDVAISTLHTNPYRAGQIFSTIDKKMLSDSQDRFKYDQTEKELLSFKFPIHKLGLTTNSLSVMALDQDDLWIADSLGTVSRYTLTSGEYTLIRKPQQSKTTQEVVGIFAQEDHVWIAGLSYMLTYNKRNGEVFSSILPKGGRPLNLVSYEGELLLAIENCGIFSWNGEFFESSKFNDSKLHDIQALTVHEGNLWAATNEGLYTLKNHRWVQNRTLVDQSVRYLCTSEQGLWGMSENTGLFFIDQEENFGIISTDTDISKIYVLPESVLILNRKKDRLQQLKILPGNTGIDMRTVSINVSTLSGLAFSSPYLIVGSTDDAAFFIHQSLL